MIKLYKIAYKVARNTTPESWVNRGCWEGQIEYNGVKVTVQPPNWQGYVWLMWVKLGDQAFGPIWVPWFSPVRRSYKRWRRKHERARKREAQAQLKRVEVLVTPNADGKLTVIRSPESEPRLPHRT